MGSRTTVSNLSAKSGTGISRSEVGENSDGGSSGRYSIADLSSGRVDWDIAARRSAYLASVARKFASGGQKSRDDTAGASATNSSTRSTFGGTNAEEKGIDRRRDKASTKQREGSPEESGGSWLVGGSSSSKVPGPSDCFLGSGRLRPAQGSPSAGISAAAVSAAVSVSSVSPDWMEVASPTFREDDDGGLKISFSRRRKSRVGFTRVGAAAACTCTKTGLQCTCNNSILPYYQELQVEGGGATAASRRGGDTAASEASWAHHVHAGNVMEGMEKEKEEKEEEEEVSGPCRSMESDRREMDHWRNLAHEIVRKSQGVHGSPSQEEGLEADQEKNPGEN